MKSRGEELGQFPGYVQQGIQHEVRCSYKKIIRILRIPGDAFVTGLHWQRRQ